MHFDVYNTEKYLPSLATIHSFCLQKKTGDKISNLNNLVSPDVFFVGLASAGLEEFERRSARGSPAILFYGDDLKRVMSALPQLNQLLAKNDNNNNNNTADILYHVATPDPRNCCGESGGSFRTCR